MRYTSAHHSARYTEDFVFSQLIPYIGNKRKLLPLIARAIAATSLTPAQATFLDAFSGSTVVSRFAKQLGFAVTANDWEPYAHALAQCFIQLNEAPTFFHSRTYTDVLSELNSLPPEEGWITHHLCPANDAAPDTSRDRMFYMRKNGMRLDAIRNRIAAWSTAGDLSDLQAAALLGPLLYQASWLANTSGVFKGFHNGWGGQTGTALYRIQADLHLEPAVFHNNHRDNTATRFDASSITEPHDIAYLDPPYNQHPYGSNYHVLNTLTLWDAPPVSPTITGRGDKSAIRRDWRTARRSAYNHRSDAPTEYARLLAQLNARYLLTSYSTDGFISLRTMLEANHHRGHTTVFLQPYKRYRVSTQRASARAHNIEFVLLTDTHHPSTRSLDESIDQTLAEILTAQASINASTSIGSETIAG
jgi:adenine-specific DNA-methyltransferase